MGRPNRALISLQERAAARAVPRKPPEPPRWAPLAEAAAYANVPHRTMRDWISQGLLPGYRLGKRQIRIDLNDVDALFTRIPSAADGR